MPLVGSIASFKTGDYDVTRRAAATIANGLAVPGSTSTFEIEASIQPITGATIEGAPEGRRPQEMRVVYTTTELRTVDDASGVDADLIDYKGETWEVIATEIWPNLSGGEFCRAFIARVAGRGQGSP